jgi:choline kinase
MNTSASVQHDLTIIIPAAGLGRRMKSYGPKALLEVSPRQTLLGRQLAVLKEHFPKADFVVVVGFEAERIVRTLPAGIRVVENERYEETNVARSVHLALRASSCRAALVVYGDLVFSPGTFANLPTGRSLVLIDVPNGEGQTQLGDEEVGCTVVGTQVTQFSYGLPTKWAQVLLLTGHELALFRKLAGAPERQKHFCFEVLNEVLERGGKLLALQRPGMQLAEVDCSRDLETARLLANTSN